MLARERLVTVTGPGGVGKSRLALEIAQCGKKEGDGAVVWVGLEDVEDGAQVAGAMQRAFEFVAGPSSTTAESIGTAIGPRRLLVVVDQLGAVADEAADYLRAEADYREALLAGTADRWCTPYGPIWPHGTTLDTAALGWPHVND